MVHLTCRIDEDHSISDSRTMVAAAQEEGELDAMRGKRTSFVRAHSAGL